mgnify:CR=1 FL=1
MAVQRIYVEKRPEHAVEAKGLLAEFRGLLGVKGLTGPVSYTHLRAHET